MNQTPSAGVPAFIEVSAEVRYWEDATVNGVEDADGSLIPFKRDALWCPVIRLADGQVMDWPAGTDADIHYKVCDAGEYWLLDAERRRIAKWSGFYVPSDFLYHGGSGYGDYIILKVGADGLIVNWSDPEVEWAGAGEDEGPGWLRLPGAPTIPLTLEQARTLAEALDIGHDCTATAAAHFHEGMAGYVPDEHKRLDEGVAKVKAADALLSGLIYAATCEEEVEHG